MKKILLDTDVLIELLRGNEKVAFHIQELITKKHLLAYTPISEAEIYKGLRSNEKEKTKVTLGAFDCLPLGREVGKRAGEYMRSYGKSHALELADALIAASAFVHRFALCTFNWKHYPMNDIDSYRIDR